MPDSDALRSLDEQALETALGELPRKSLVAVSPDTPLAQALALMHERGVGSVLVLGAGGEACGILTRHDLIDRVTLPQRPLATPIEKVMSSPVHALSVLHTLSDAGQLMSRHGIRHVPVTQEGRVVGLVSQRDVFLLQRLSVRQIGAAIRHAGDVSTLAACADDIRRLARDLLGRGVGARQLTQLVSHLNDLLCVRVVAIVAAEQGVDMERACWLAFGSEGRSEQTIATDQDNGLVFSSDDPGRDRPRWLEFGRRVNQALDACGYPLCKGGVMAGDPACCLTADEWRGRFHQWMEQGTPEDLLKASIYFDFRALAGRIDLAGTMREDLSRTAKALPRFLKQLAENALRNSVPLNWLDGLRTQRIEGRRMLDLKLHGSMVFVDAARLYALACGVVHTGTRQRLEAAAVALKVPPAEAAAWTGAFDAVQTFRLRAQVACAAGPDRPNLLDVGALNDLDRRMLREALRVARRLQQRVALDYRR